MLELTLSLRWWQESQNRGLIRDASDDFDPSRIATPFCGVSLAYLEEVAASLDRCLDKSLQPSTRTIMHEIIGPALTKSGGGKRWVNDYDRFQVGWDHPMHEAQELPSVHSA